MLGSLNVPTVASLRFSPEISSSVAGATRSDRNVSFSARTPCKSTIRAFTETAPAIETRRATSLYEVLRIKQNASPVEIKTAYRSLAKLYHPDSSRSDADGRDFIEIRNAYSTLSDPAARELYDLSLGAMSRRRSVHYSAPNRSGFYTNRRWETDQCW